MLGIFKNLFAAGDDTKLKETIDEGAVLVDVRTTGEFAGGNVTGSINIPLDQLPNQLRWLKKDKPIVVFCRSGNRSKSAKAMLEQNGFSKVTDGGGINNVNRSINNK